MTTKEITQQHIQQSVKVKSDLLNDQKAVDTIVKIAEICTEAYRRGNKVIWAGNGGSAADAQHMAGEMVSKFYFDRPAIPSIALTTDTSIITAIGNDYGYHMVFSRQLQANAVKGDVFIGISTSGNSQNLVESLPMCREIGVTAVALVGSAPCAMDDWDIVVKIPSSSTPRIQECQTLIGHIICCIVEENLFASKYKNKKP